MRTLWNTRQHTFCTVIFWRKVYIYAEVWSHNMAHNRRISVLLAQWTLYYLGNTTPIIVAVHRSKTRITEGCPKPKSPETRQVKERLVSTLEHLQVLKWDMTRCPEEKVSSVGMPHPLQMFYGNLSQLDKKSNSVIRSRSVIRSNWCNDWSMEVVTVDGQHPEYHVTSGRGGPHIVW